MGLSETWQASLRNVKRRESPGQPSHSKTSKRQIGDGGLTAAPSSCQDVTTSLRDHDRWSAVPRKPQLRSDHPDRDRLAAEPARSLLQGRTGGDAAPGSPTRSGADPAGVQGLGALPVQAAPAGRNEWAVDSDGYHQCIGFWMLQSEQAIIRCVAAGEQKQGHGDAELLLKELHHSSCLGQPTGTNRPTKTLTRLSPAGPMVVQRNWKCPGSTGRKVPSCVLQIDSASSSFLLTRAMSCLSRSCSCSSGPATIGFLARESIQLSASLLRASHELDRPQVAAGRRCCGA